MKAFGKLLQRVIEGMVMYQGNRANIVACE